MIKGAYSGSLIQQNFGESVENHGYLLWNIEDNSYEEINIDNDYKFITVYIRKGFDYKNINYTLNTKFKHLRLRVIWDDIDQMNIENELALKRYFTEKYNPIEFKLKKIKQTKFEKNEKIKKVALARNKERVGEILKDYLKANEVDNETIKSVIQFDEFINNRLNENKNVDSYEIAIDGILIDNFRSYAPDQQIDLRNKNGLIQVIGKNQLGKTTIFDAICYCLFGKTLYPPKQKKHKDAKYVNFNNNRNDCKVTLSLKINGASYEITRQTEIEYKTKDIIKNCTTKFNIENTSGFSENNIDEEQFKNIIGSFDEFALTNFTTGDTLTAILSSDVSVFKDMIIKSSGLGVFELKTEEVKKYRKERLDTHGKITLNQEKEESDIVYLKDSILEGQKNISELESFIDSEKYALDKINEELLSLNLELAKNNSTPNTDINLLLKRKTDITKKRETLINSLKINNEKILELSKIVIDNTEYENLKSKLELLKDSERKSNLSLRDIRDKKMSIEYGLKSIESDLEKIKKQGLDLKNKLTSIENSKVCTLCKQPLDDTHIQHVEQEKTKINEEIESKRIEYQNKIAEKDSLLIEQKNNLALFENETNRANEIIESISDTMERITTIEYNFKQIEDKDKINESNLLIQDSILSSENELSQIEYAISEFEKNKENIENLKTIQLKLKEKEQEKISKEVEIKNITDKILDAKIKIESNKKDIEYKEANIQKYIKQKQYEQMEKAYLEAISRNGIPTLLLKSNIPDINDALDYLLSDVNFHLSFDEDLNLIFKKGDFELDIMTGTSGMERTFLSCALKMSLMKASNVSAFDTIIMDEIMDKLDSENLQLFIDMIGKIKKWNNRVMVINHLHDISPDYILVPYHKNNMTYIDLR